MNEIIIFGTLFSTPAIIALISVLIANRKIKKGIEKKEISKVPWIVFGIISFIEFGVISSPGQSTPSSAEAIAGIVAIFFIIINLIGVLIARTIIYFLFKKIKKTIIKNFSSSHNPLSPSSIHLLIRQNNGVFVSEGLQVH